MALTNLCHHNPHAQSLVHQLGGVAPLLGCLLSPRCVHVHVSSRCGSPPPRTPALTAHDARSRSLGVRKTAAFFAGNLTRHSADAAAAVAAGGGVAVLCCLLAGAEDEAAEEGGEADEVCKKVRRQPACCAGAALTDN